MDDQPAPKQPQRTLENTREVDETMVDPNDEEVLKDEATDQFAEYFKGRHPKILITTGREASGVRIRLSSFFASQRILRFSISPYCLLIFVIQRVFQFIREFRQMFPAAKFYKRRNYLLPQIFEFCKNRGYTDVIVVHERAKRPGKYDAFISLLSSFF